jgi:uncharacterized protein YoxC
MDWIQVWTIIGVVGGINIAIAAIFGTFLIWAFNKLDGDIKAIDGDLKTIDTDMKTWMRHSTSRMDQMNSRTDQLYQMFIDLLKEKRNE